MRFHARSNVRLSVFPSQNSFHIKSLTFFFTDNLEKKNGPKIPGREVCIYFYKFYKKTKTKNYDPEIVNLPSTSASTASNAPTKRARGRPPLSQEEKDKRTAAALIKKLKPIKYNTLDSR